MSAKLHINSLLLLLKRYFSSIASSASQSDAIMSSYAMFSLKEQSFLSFQNSLSQTSDNLKSVYHINSIFSDTHTKRLVDPLETEDLRGIFLKIFMLVRQAGYLEAYRFLNGHYLISVDGTGYFSSNSVHCKNCMEKKDKNGNTRYYHQMLGASVVHPDNKIPLPLMPEHICRQDGETKNDCERNASVRFLRKLREDHPRIKAIIVEDALGSNAPHIREILRHRFSFIIGAKPDGNKFLYSQAEKLKEAGLLGSRTAGEGDTVHIYEYANGLQLNESNPDVAVNFLRYWEYDSKSGKYLQFAWVTDIEITEQNVHDIMRGGRSRWKIENETFNTLKNQGYQFEHNFGHGYENLSSNFAVLMMLAFLVDQVQQLSNPVFRKALKKSGSRASLWANIRKLFFSFQLENAQHMYLALAEGFRKPVLETGNTS